MENFSAIIQTVWRPAQKNSWEIASTPLTGRGLNSFWNISIFYHALRASRQLISLVTSRISERQMPNEQRRNGWADPDERWLIRCAGTAERRWRRSRGDACHLARATCRRVNPSKNVVSGLQPKREVAGSPNFQVRSALVWIMCHSANQPPGVKIVPRGQYCFFQPYAL